MQFFSLDGFDSQSYVLLVFHMCECVNMLDYCVNVCFLYVSVCPKEQACVDCTPSPSLRIIPFLKNYKVSLSSLYCSPVLSDNLPVFPQSTFYYHLVPGMIASAC